MFSSDTTSTPSVQPRAEVGGMISQCLRFDMLLGGWDNVLKTVTLYAKTGCMFAHHLAQEQRHSSRRAI